MNVPRRFSGILAAVVLVVSAVASAQSGVKITAGDEVAFTPAPGAKGVQTATLGGNPNGAGWYVERIKMVAGAANPPHTHKNAQLLTVISGDMQIGFGKTANKTNLRDVHAGGVVVIPAGVPHYSFAKSNLVYDASGMGPSTNMPIKTAKM